MIIEEVKLKIKRALSFVERREVYTVLIIILVGISSFGLGRLSTLANNRPPVRIETTNSQSNSKLENSNQGASVVGALDKGGYLVASKNGTKYYFPWCGGVSRITEANKITFATVVEAEKAGYTPAANCKGL